MIDAGLNLQRALADLAEPPPPAFGPSLADALRLGDQFVAVDSLAGPLHVAMSGRGIRMVELTEDEAAFRQAYAARFGLRPLRRAPKPPAGLLAVLAGRRPTNSLTFDLASLPAFHQAVLHKTAEIPRGEVRPYAWVAAEAGRPAAIRAAGTALARNPVPILIPCHRVVRSDGRIGNYGYGPATKARLLALEGIDLDELADLAAGGMRYVGSTTTSIYCLPTCASARRITVRNRVTFRDAEDAAAAGYRACRQCRPNASPGFSTS
jgi:O-6-methylguanine DNA methyltransferase